MSKLYFFWGFLWRYCSQINWKMLVMEFSFWPSCRLSACSYTRKCAPSQIFSKYFQRVILYSINLHRATLRQSFWLLRVYKTLQNSWKNPNRGIKWVTCLASTSNSYRIFFDYQSHVFTLLLFNISIYGIFFLEKF